MHIHIYISFEDTVLIIEVQSSHIYAHRERNITRNVIQQSYAVNALERNPYRECLP